MHKLLPLLGLILTASLPEGLPAAAAWRFAGPLPSTFVSGGSGRGAVVVLVAGKGGGMGGGATTGGMGGGATTGGMGGGAMTGGMGGGAATGGMGGGAATGGMGGGAATGGMGGGATTGGMGGGAATGGMGGGAFGGTGGGMFNDSAASFGTNNSSGWPGDSAHSSYYTYQCVTPTGQCSFVAPASLRASSLRAGARCSCSDGLSQGQVK